MESILGVGAVLLLVLANAFFVASEFSLVSARRTRIDQLALEGNRAAIAAKKAIAHLDHYIAATQLGITLASLALGWIGEPSIGHIIERLLPEDLAHSIGPGVSVAVAFSIVTLLHIVIGELVPKSIALQQPESTALAVARPIRIFGAVFRPVISVMNGIGNSVVKLLGFEPAGEHSHVHSPEELEMLVHSSKEAGLLQESEEKMLRRVFDFGELQIRDVMHPRTEVEAVPQDVPLPELLKLISTLHYSRYPVYKGGVDTVTGILNVKDLLDALVRDPQLITSGEGKFDLTTILRTPLFFPQTTAVDRILDEMQKAKQQMVIVIDEYGGMAGVATMEDILEEIVGEVQDEFDVETNPIETHGDHSIVDGLTTINDVIERFGAPGTEYISTTIGGYVAEQLDRIPTIGDTVLFGEYDLKVEAMDGLRASMVRFIKQPKEPKLESDTKNITDDKTDSATPAKV